ncbi:hypothetical protein [Paenibacillus silvestris]|nr:hypothetical protein [Paenibacillus silvestris]
MWLYHSISRSFNLLLLGAGTCSASLLGLVAIRLPNDASYIYVA